MNKIELHPFIDNQVTITLLILVAFYFIVQAILENKKKRTIEDVPKSKIRSASQGYVELHGKAYSLDNQHLVSPVSQNKCFWYEYNLKGLYNSKDEKISESSNIPFLLKDETGICAIDTEEIDFIIGEYNLKQTDYVHLPPQLQERVTGEDFLIYSREIPEDSDIVIIGNFSTDNNELSSNKIIKSSKLYPVILGIGLEPDIINTFKKRCLRKNLYALNFIIVISIILFLKLF